MNFDMPIPDPPGEDNSFKLDAPIKGAPVWMNVISCLLLGLVSLLGSYCAMSWLAWLNR